jgi:CheY-like chemotaxis protein
MRVPNPTEDQSKAFTIIIAEDDEDDYLLLKEAFYEAGAQNPIHWVKDGEELIQFLSKVSADEEETKNVGMILLDLNMPKKDGREALKEIKNSPLWRRIPVLILTTSNAESDILNIYDLGVNSYIQKPVRFPELVEVAKSIIDYWFKTVQFPSKFLESQYERKSYQYFNS